MKKQEIINRLKLDLGIDIEYITFAIWETKGLVKTSSQREWVGRIVRDYSEEDYQNIKNQIINLILTKKIHPKGWKRIIYATKKQKTKR